MNEHSDLLPNLQHEEFEMQMRGYSRRQVDEYVARRNAEIRDLEHRLARALDESEHLRREISTVRQQALAGRPAHEEVSERIGQILKLAEDEAKAQRNKTDEEIAGLRAETQQESERLRTEARQESDRVRTDAREQAERMLTAAQEQAERTISVARTEADKLRNSARTEADQLTSESRKQADSALGEAKAQSKRVLDEATARATAIHDGAERRLSLLSTRHAETVRRLTDILDGVQGLVAAEAARMSLEDEVNQSVSTAVAALEPATSADGTGTEQAASGSPADSARERDFAMLAPPAPETMANGTVAPPPAGTNSGPLPSDRLLTPRPVTIHPVTLNPGPGFATPDAGSASAPESGGTSPMAGTSVFSDEPDIIDVPGNSGTPGADVTGAPGAGTSSAFPGPPPLGRHATPLPPPPEMPRRLGAPPTESQRNSLAIPGAPLSGPMTTGQHLGGLNALPHREGQQDGGQAGHAGLIDPDEPTDGIRLMR
jgi:cell division septum initiation protein DivIVA